MAYEMNCLSFDRGLGGVYFIALSLSIHCFQNLTPAVSITTSIPFTNVSPSYILTLAPRPRCLIYVSKCSNSTTVGGYFFLAPLFYDSFIEL